MAGNVENEVFTVQLEGLRPPCPRPQHVDSTSGSNLDPPPPVINTHPIHADVYLRLGFFSVLSLNKQTNKETTMLGEHCLCLRLPETGTLLLRRLSTSRLKCVYKEMNNNVQFETQSGLERFVAETDRTKPHFPVTPIRRGSPPLCLPVWTVNPEGRTSIASYNLPIL